MLALSYLEENVGLVVVIIIIFLNPHYVVFVFETVFVVTPNFIGNILCTLNRPLSEGSRMDLPSINCASSLYFKAKVYKLGYLFNLKTVKILYFSSLLSQCVKHFKYLPN